MRVRELTNGRWVIVKDEAPQAVTVEDCGCGYGDDCRYAEPVEQVNDPRPGSRFDGPPAHPPPGKLVGVGVSVELTPEEGAGVTRLLKEQGKWPGGAAETGESAAETSVPTERAGEPWCGGAPERAEEGSGDREAAADALVLDLRGLR